MEIFCDYIKHYGEQKLKNNLQKKYKVNLVNSNMEKSDNNMHINVLFKKLLFDEANPSFEQLKTKTLNDLEEIITNYISGILKRMQKEKIPKNWSKNIEEWFENTNIDDGEYSLDKYKPEDYDNIINKTLLSGVTKVVKYEFEDTESGWNSSEDTFDSKNLEKIGKIGEQIVYSLMIKQYGIDNVVWHSQIDKYAPYDIKYFDGKKTKYIEVKSSTRINKMNWYISRRELEFYKSRKEDYELFFVKDIHKDSQRGALVQRITNANIVINKDLIGMQKNGNILITPIKYKGLA